MAESAAAPSEDILRMLLSDLPNEGNFIEDERYTVPVRLLFFLIEVRVRLRTRFTLKYSNLHIVPYAEGNTNVCRYSQYFRSKFVHALA